MTHITHTDAIPEVSGSRYPPPHDAPCAPRRARRLSPAVGVTQFGVNLCTIPPGAWASQRHSHSHEDELVVMLTGELVLIDDNGEHVVGPGAVMGHPAGDGNAHQLVNPSDADATYIVVGGHSEDDFCLYPDIGMKTTAARYTHADAPYLTLDGAPYPRR